MNTAQAFIQSYGASRNGAYPGNPSRPCTEASMRAPALLATSRHGAPALSGPSARPVCDPDFWGTAGVEPTVEELMADPMTALVMRRDRIGPAEVMEAVQKARRALAEPPVRSAPPVPFMRPPVHWTAAPPRSAIEPRLPLANAV